MNNHTFSLAPLAALDAAPETEPTGAELARCEQLLHTIIELDRNVAQRSGQLVDEPTGTTRRLRRRHPVPLAIAAVAVAALALAGVGVMQVLDRGDGLLSTEAVGSWTPSPVRLAADTTGEASATSASPGEKWCWEQLDGVNTPGYGQPATVSDADRRGVVTSMVVTRGGQSVYCLVGPGDAGMWEAIGPVAPVAPDAVTVDSSGVHGDHGAAFAYTEGLVGADVTGITLHVGGLNLTALVGAGRWTAWWPSPNGDTDGTATITTTGGSRRIVSIDSLLH